LKFELPKSVLSVVAALGATLSGFFGANASDTKMPVAPAQPMMALTAAVSSQGENSQPPSEGLNIQTEAPIALRQVSKEENFMSRAILLCLKNRSLPEGRGKFFVEVESYLKSKQLEVKRHPEKIKDVKANFFEAIKYYRQNYNSFDLDSYLNSGSTIARAAQERGRA